MNAKQENRQSRNYALVTFFNNHEATLSARVPQLTPVLIDFNASVEKIGFLDRLATDNITGFSIQKQVYRTIMRDHALKFSGALKAFYKLGKDEVNLRRVSLTKSELDGQRDGDILNTCEKLYTQTTATTLVLAPYGIGPTDLADFGAAVQTFKLFFQTTKDERSEGGSAGALVDKAFDECDEIIEIISDLMQTQSQTEPLLYGQFLNNKAIDDNTGGGPSTPPDFTVELAPNNYTVVATLPYNPSQKFKAENNSPSDVLWSLSLATDSFSTPPTILTAGSTSIKLSSTLAPNGDNLLFLNNSPTPITMKITLVDE